MAGTFEQIGGAALGAAGSAFGPLGSIAGSYIGKKAGEYLDKSKEEKQLEAMQKAQFAKLKRGDDLGLTGAQKNQALAGVQKQQMAAQQSAIAEQQRMAAMGGARQGAFFQAQQQQAQAQQDALAQSRLGVEQQSQAIAEQRKNALEAMLRQRAMEDQASRGKRVMSTTSADAAGNKITSAPVATETPEAQQFAEWAGSKLDTKYRPSVYGAFGGSTTAGE